MKVQYLYVVSQYISSESLEDRSRELRQTLLMRDQQDTGTSCSPLHPLGGPAAVAICPCEVGCHDSRQADSSALCAARSGASGAMVDELLQPASTRKGKGKGGPSASPALKVDVRSPVV